EGHELWRWADDSEGGTGALCSAVWERGSRFRVATWIHVHIRCSGEGDLHQTAGNRKPRPLADAVPLGVFTLGLRNSSGEIGGVFFERYRGKICRRARPQVAVSRTLGCHASKYCFGVWPSSRRNMAMKALVLRYPSSHAMVSTHSSAASRRSAYSS